MQFMYGIDIGVKERLWFDFLGLETDVCTDDRKAYIVCDINRCRYNTGENNHQRPRARFHIGGSQALTNRCYVC